MNKQPAKLPLFAVISIVFTIQLLLVSGFVAYTTYKTGRTSLIRSLLKSYHNHSINIDTEVQVEENLSLDYAIPCGLIINELVTNSLKYAFNEASKGKISVKIKSDDKQIVLIISDNGSGIPENIEFDTSDTLGLYLVKIVVEDQLHGSVKINRDKGTEFRITFSHTAGRKEEDG